MHALCLWYVPGDSHHECCFIVACLLLGALADNAGGENKNQWVMRYLSLLVDRGCFRSTCLALLQVGHTHEDIDAIFSIMSCEFAKTLDWDSPMKRWQSASIVVCICNHVVHRGAGLWRCIVPRSGTPSRDPLPDPPVAKGVCT